MGCCAGKQAKKSEDDKKSQEAASLEKPEAKPSANVESETRKKGVSQASVGMGPSELTSAGDMDESDMHPPSRTSGIHPSGTPRKSHATTPMNSAASNPNKTDHSTPIERTQESEWTNFEKTQTDESCRIEIPVGTGKANDTPSKVPLTRGSSPSTKSQTKSRQCQTQTKQTKDSKTSGKTQQNGGKASLLESPSRSQGPNKKTSSKHQGSQPNAGALGTASPSADATQNLDPVQAT